MPQIISMQTTTTRTLITMIVVISDVDRVEESLTLGAELGKEVNIGVRTEPNRLVATAPKLAIACDSDSAIIPVIIG